MSALTLDDAEGRQIEKIDETIGWCFASAVRNHFNACGKLETFLAVITPEEKRAQKAALANILEKRPCEASLATLIATNIFMNAARRIGTDAELAALMPKNILGEKEAALLDKHGLSSLAVLLRARPA